MSSNVLSNVANDGFVIVPSDTVLFNKACAGILVGGGGVVTLVTGTGTVLAITAVDGQIIPMTTKRVNFTGTTASLMIGLIP